MIKNSKALRRRQLDQSLQKYGDIPEFPHGYVREIRDALDMTSYQLAKRLKVKQPTVINLERSERDGTVSLNTLSRAANALGCKLVYAFIPQKPLQEQVIDQAHVIAVARAENIFRSMALEKQSTTPEEQEEVVNQIVQDLIQKGELWK